MVVGGSYAQMLHQQHRLAGDADLFRMDAIPQGAENVWPVNRWLTKISLDGFRYDLINSSFHRLKMNFQPVIVAGIRVQRLRDVAVNKLDAILSRPRKSDYYDVYFLLKEIRLTTMLADFKKAYPRQGIDKVLKCLVFFADVENDRDPVLIKKVDWNEVKTVIQSKVKLYQTLNSKAQ